MLDLNICEFVQLFKSPQYQWPGTNYVLPLDFIALISPTALHYTFKMGSEAGKSSGLGFWHHATLGGGGEERTPFC